VKFIGLLGCKIYEENGHCVDLLLRILGQEKGTMNRYTSKGTDPNEHYQRKFDSSVQVALSSKSSISYSHQRN